MFKTKLMILALAIAMVCRKSTASPISDKNIDKEQLNKKILSNKYGDSFDIYGSSSSTGDDDELLSYDPLANRQKEYQTSGSHDIDNLVKSLRNLERESSTVTKPKRPQEAASTVQQETDSPNADKFGSIAFNSREVRIVGPNQKEVEMKDDMATKMVVVLDNLQKEAGEVWDQVNDKLDKGWKDIKRSEVWSQVNEKLDKGWTDLKTMVEGVVSPSSKRQQP